MANKYITYISIFIISLLIFYNKNYKKLYEDIYSKKSLNYSGSDEKRSVQYEIVFILITSSNCPYCKDKKLPKIVDNIKIALEKKTKKMNYNFTTIGISIDKNVEKGIKHLKEDGYFDEIMVGNDWLNTGALRYIYDKIKGPATIPQILITKRQYQFSETKVSYHKIGLANEKQIFRRVGINEIKNWYKNAIPLPTNF